MKSNRPEDTYDITLDVSGLLCPYPLIETKKALNLLSQGKILKVISTDPASIIDFKVFTAVSAHHLLHQETLSERYYFWIKKG